MPTGEHQYYSLKSHYMYVVSGTLGLELLDGPITQVEAESAITIPLEHDPWTKLYQIRLRGPISGF